MSPQFPLPGVTPPIPRVEPRLSLSLDFNDGDVRAQLSSLAREPKNVRLALARSINKALNGTRTDIVKDLRARTVLKAGAIRDGIAVQPVFWKDSTRASGYVRIDKTGLRLTDFQVRPLRQTSQKGKLPSEYKRLSYRLYRGGKQYDDTSRGPGAGEHSKLFIIPGKSGLSVRYRKIGEQPRKVGGRMIAPSYIKFGPALQFFVANPVTQQRILAGADLRFRKELAHQVSYLGGGSI